jgi:hypothetical protein
VVETRKNSFTPNSPETQKLLKNFASQAHTYQVAAKNAGKKLNANQARANLKGNAAAVANAAAAAAAVNVSAAAGSAAAAVKVNATPSALRTRLTAMKNKAGAAIRNLRAPVNYNKIILKYNSSANTNVKKFSKAVNLAQLYRQANLFRKNFTPGGRLLTSVIRGGAVGQYNSRQKFLNEMALHFKVKAGLGGVTFPTKTTAGVIPGQTAQAAPAAQAIPGWQAALVTSLDPNVKKFFNKQPLPRNVNAIKLELGAVPDAGGRYNFKKVRAPYNARYWNEYHGLNDELEREIAGKQFNKYIARKRNIGKNRLKYPSGKNFFTAIEARPGLLARKNAILAVKNRSFKSSQELTNFYKNFESLKSALAGQPNDSKIIQELENYKKAMEARMTKGGLETLAFAPNGKPRPVYYIEQKKAAIPTIGKTQNQINNALRIAINTDRLATQKNSKFKKFWDELNKYQAALKLETAKAAAVSAANKASAVNISAANATPAAANAARAASEARAQFNKTNRSNALRFVRDAANAASKSAQASLAAAKKREAEAAAKVVANAKAAAATKAAANKAAANKVAANAKAAAATKAAANKAAANKVAANAKAAAAANKAIANKAAKITKLKKNISNARNAANKALQAANASKAAAAAGKAQTLRAQLNSLGADQAAKNVANQQVQEARGHANAAKKAAANRTFKYELAQFNKVKSYAKPESLATILARMEAAATEAEIATNNTRLKTAREDKRKALIKYFIQEVWQKTARGGAPGTNNVNRIATSYGLTPLTNADRAIMNGLIPKTPNKNSIIGWKSLQRLPDTNYGERREVLRGVLFPQPAAAPPPPPPPSLQPAGSTRGASLLGPNKRGRPSTWTINTAFTNAYAKNNQNPANLFVKINNGTYRKVNNSASGNFTNANVYNWNAAVKNFTKR